MKMKIVYRAFPEEIRGSIFGVTFVKNNRYLILINNETSADEQDFTLRHELAHIALGHAEKTLPLDKAIALGGFLGDGWIEREREADSLAERMTVDELMEICK